jgi:Pyruvate/2-oxoacid:ferredoxin oxidoreductase gamma subunit
MMVLDPGGRAGRKQQGLILLLAALRQLGILPVEALEEAIRRGRRADVVAENLAALAISGPK